MKKNNIIVIQSRQTSTRFPNKVLKKIGKFTICEIIKKRVEKSKLSKQIIFAIPNNNKKVAMFCTGGIRCEIASSFMMSKGFEEVYQLNGGILNYLETVVSAENLWEGECFVFDERVSLDRALNQGKYVQCFGCRRPLSEEDLKSKNYLKGVSCSYCYDVSSDSDKERFAQRQKQIELAEARGHEHMGASAKQKK